MNTISDNELILFHYRDGLDAARVAEIENALLVSATLRTRYAQLQLVLDRVDSQPVPEADDRFVERILRKLNARIDASQPAPLHSDIGARIRSLLHAMLQPRPAFAAACVLVIAIGLGFYAGRWSAPEPDEIAQTRANAMAARVLDVYVSEHLRSTEGLLLTAVNGDDSPIMASNRDLAAALVESNRLYAQAAMRAGDTRLANFLRQLEPVLIDLANRSPEAAIQSSDGLRDYLRKTDLLFQVRATQARIDGAGQHRT
ncbi:MAG: hypothetical protein ABI451_03205 [Dokdonella sp.]